jgi:hypothetical protein
MDRETELAMIETHLLIVGADHIPARRAYICNDRTPAEDRKLKRWKQRAIMQKNIALRLRAKNRRGRQ